MRGDRQPDFGRYRPKVSVGEASQRHRIVQRDSSVD
jgi:hypothetical protein